jgi:hypothetical protein
MKMDFVKPATIILILLLSYAAHAQTAFGLKGGLNLTNLNVDDPEASYDSRAGYHVGIFLRGRFSKIGIQPEVLLSTASTDVSTLLGDYKDSFTYLSVPVMIKFYIISGLNIHAGPQFSFLLDGERKGEFGRISSTTDIKEYYKSSDVSVSAGAGWDFPFGLNVDFRYNIGVTDINDVSGGEEAKSRIFQVSLGWNFLK